MEKTSIVKIIEATAGVNYRQNSRLFTKKSIDEEAISLYSQYCSGGTNYSTVQKALALRGLSFEDLKSLFVLVEANEDISTLLSSREFAWIMELEPIIDSYSKYNAEKLINTIIVQKSDFEPTRKELLIMVQPFIEHTYRFALEQCDLNEKTAFNFSLYVYQCISSILTNVFPIAVKACFNDETITYKHLLEDSNKESMFLEWLCRGGIVDVVGVYPMAFKLTVECIQRLKENLHELAQRIRNDYSEIERVFCPDKKLGSLQSIRFGLSDLHNGNQGVCILCYENAHIVYKPRNMGIDVSWNQMLSRIHDAFPAFQVSAGLAINKQTYGYVSFIEHNECKSIDSYYRNAGMLLCIASMFGATDLHYENIIATTNSPVVVDLETIISPRPQGRFALIEIDKKTSFVMNVGRTLLLSRWVGEISGGSREIGGLISLYETGKNSPFIGNNRYSAYQYPEQFVEGFCDLYHWILQNKSVVRRLIYECGFSDCKVRYVFRRTALYVKLYNHFLNAHFLKRSTMYEAVLSRLGAGIILSFDDKSAERLWPVEQAEEIAIRNGDVPYFFCRGNSNNLETQDGVVVPSFFSASPVELVYKNLEEMSEDRLQYELNYIKKSIQLSKCQPQEQSTTELLSYRDIRRDRKAEDSTVIRSAIEKIHMTLDDYRLDDIDFDYFAPVRDQKTTRYGLAVLEQTLYSGIWGVLLFHAAYARWKNDQHLRDQILKKIKKMLDDISENDDNSIYLRLGLAEGIAGVCQALICLSSLLNKPGMIADSVSVMLKSRPFIEREKIPTDYFGGIAGHLYISCKLYKASGDERLIDIIKIDTAKMLSSRELDETTGLYIWKTKSEYAPLTGLAHGQSGYAVALSAAYAILKDEHILSALEDTLLYEEGKYNETHNNWYDFRRFLVARRDQDTDQVYHERFMYGSCSGTPGIGMSRIAILKFKPDLGTEKDIQRAVRFCGSHPLVGCDSLCCGTMGWIEFLIDAYNKFGESKLLEVARSIATSVSPDVSGERWILSNLKGIYDVSLFTGISGIGYEFIRTELPDEIPPVLI